MMILGPMIITVSTNEVWYVPVPITCQLVNAFTAISVTNVTIANETLTFSDGTTTIGTITIAFSGAAEGDVDRLSLSDLTVELNITTPLKIEAAGTSTAGAVSLTMILDPYHSTG